MPSDPVRVVPYKEAFAIVASDATTFPNTRAIYVGGAGNLAVTINDQAVTFNGVLAGHIYPIQATQVLATGTTATNIVRLY